MKLSSLTAPGLLAHISAHILHNICVQDQRNLCGLCLSNGLCTFQFVPSSKGSSVDVKASQCPSIRNFSIKSAAKYTETSPCTNHPLICPLCPEKSAGVWKYNLRSHLVDKHGANPELYLTLFQLHPDEKIKLKAVFQAVPRQSKISKEVYLPASEAHSS